MLINFMLCDSDNFRFLNKMSLKCTTDLNFEVDFGSNGDIGTVATWWNLILFGKNNNFHSLYNFSSNPNNITLRISMVSRN